MAAQVVVVGARVGADLQLVAMGVLGVSRVEEGGGGAGGGGEDLDASLAGGAHLLDVFEELVQSRLLLLPTSSWDRAPPLLGEVQGGAVGQGVAMVMEDGEQRLVGMRRQSSG